MTLFDSTFNKVFDSYMNWDLEDQRISTTNARVLDDVLTMEFEVPGLSNKDIEVKVEDRFLFIKGESGNRKFEKKFKIHDAFDLNQTSAVAKDGLLSIEIPKYEDRKSKSITVKVK